MPLISKYAHLVILPEQVLFTEHHLRKEAIQHQDEKSDQPNISGKPKPV